VILRLAWLLRQVVSGDELHAVRVVLTEPLRQVLVTYHGSDNCLPLSAVYSLLIRLGVPLSELAMRLPVLLSSVAALVVVPLLVERVTDRRTALTLGWLMAVSPPLVLYARIARPYGVLVLLGSVTVAVLWRWSRRPTLITGAAAGVLVGLTGYVHLGALPFVLSPLAFFALEALAARVVPALGRRSVAVSLPALLGAGAWSALCCLAFLVPTWPSLSALIELKRTSSEMTVRTYQAVARLQSGSTEVWVTWVFWILAVAGLSLLVRRAPRLGLYSLTLLVGQVVGLHVLSPLALNNPLVFNRYMVVSLPVVLLWMAVAITLPGRVRPAVQVVVSGAVLVVLLATSPLLRPWMLRSSFAHSSESLYFIRSHRQARDLPALQVYESLRDDPTPGAVIEFPFHTMWRYARTLRIYQRTHGREVLVSTPERLLVDPRLRFRNMVRPVPDDLLSSRAAFLVLHLEPEAEEAALDTARGGRPRPRPRKAGTRRDDATRRAGQLAKMARRAASLRSTLEAEWGPPDVTGDGLQVWNLERVRRTVRTEGG
jgi:hypothetical protein